MDYTVPVTRVFVGKARRPDSRYVAERNARRKFCETHNISIRIDPDTRKGVAVITKKDEQK